MKYDITPMFMFNGVIMFHNEETPYEISSAYQQLPTVSCYELGVKDSFGDKLIARINNFTFFKV